MLARAVEKSANRKIGDVSATYVSQISCPTTCPFMGSGCYAESGMVGFTTRRLNLNTTGKSSLDAAIEEAAQIDTLSGTRPLRLHVVGDCVTDEAAQIVSSACARYSAKHGMPVWTYTHAWRVVLRSSWGTVSVLASCETPIDVLQAEALGYATAIVVDEHESITAYRIGDVKVLPCPQQTGRTTNCETCRLCFADTKRIGNITIAFAAHGTSKAKVKSKL